MAGDDIVGNKMTSEAQELLLADIKAFDDAFWRSEEIGERRVNFLLTLVAAAIAGLAALYTSDDSMNHWAERLSRNAGISAICLLALLVVGWMTWRRMKKRNQVSEEFKAKGHYARYIACSHAGLVRYQPFWDFPTGGTKYAGLLELVAIINALISLAITFFVVIALVSPHTDAPIAVCALVVAFVSAAAVACLVGGLQIWDGNRNRKKWRKQYEEHYKGLLESHYSHLPPYP